MRSILPIVECDGDFLTVPTLIRRVLHDHEHFDVPVLPPHMRGDLPRIKSNFVNFFKAAILENAAILMVLDFDCDFCDSVPKERQALIDMARSIRADQPFEACFIVKEYESLFLCDEATTRKVFNAIPTGLTFPAKPESVRDAKGWLSKTRPKGSAYKTTIHQQKLTAQLDLPHLRSHSPSFRDFEAALLRLIMTSPREALA